MLCVYSVCVCDCEKVTIKLFTHVALWHCRFDLQSWLLLRVCAMLQEVYNTHCAQILTLIAHRSLLHVHLVNMFHSSTVLSARSKFQQCELERCAFGSCLVTSLRRQGDSL